MISSSACQNGWDWENNWGEKLVRLQGTFIHCWWGWKLGQPLWKQVWNILEKLKIDQPSHPAIPLLGMYSKVLENTCPTMFTDALVTISPYSGNMCTQIWASGVQHGLTLLHGWPDWWRRWWKHGVYTRIAHKRTVWCTRLKRSWSRSKPERWPGQWSPRLSLGAQWLCSRRCKGHQINIWTFALGSGSVLEEPSKEQFRVLAPVHWTSTSRRFTWRNQLGKFFPLPLSYHGYLLCSSF